jgi:hypothetical protein
MSVAACPQCEGEVTLPLGARAASRVRCPLCEAEYSLSEIYDKLPPMLILLDVPVEAHVGAGGMSHGEGAFDSMFAPSGEANGEGELHLAGDEGSFDFGSPSEGGAAVATATSRTLPARAKRPQKSAIKEIVKIVLGGVVGLTIGFFILLWAAGRDLASDVAQKPIGQIMPSWMQWSIPPAHRHPKPAPAVDSTDEGAEEEDAAEGAAETDGDGETADGDGMTDASGDTTPNDSTNTQETPGDSSTSETPSDSGSANEQPSDPLPEKDPPKTPPVEDPGFEITPPKPEFEIEEPKLDPLPGDIPPMDDPKVDDPTVDEPKVDMPGDPPTTEENPFDIPPSETPNDDPTVTDPAEMPEVTPDAPMDDPMEAETKKPAAGLKVETPVDGATLESARSAASGALDTLMPSDVAAKTKFTREKYDSYAKLCEYAQSASHSTPDVQAANAEGAKMMVLMVAADETDNLVLGQLANAWLSKTRGNDGIALSGKATAVDTAGGLTTVTVELPALGEKLAARTVTIVTRENAEVKAGDNVAAVGSVIEKPTEKIEGYAGTDSQVIWGAWVGKRGT